MKNLIRKIKNLSRIQMHFVWFYLAAFLLSALVLLSCNFWYKNRMTEYAVRSSQNTLQLHINALDTQLENTSSFLSNFLLMDTDHVTLATTDKCGRMSQRPAFHSEHLCPAALSLRQYQRTFVLCPMVGCLSHEKQPD